ncbi:hypothetical protein Peur_040930 [Populus x canadensis]
MITSSLHLNFLLDEMAMLSSANIMCDLVQNSYYHYSCICVTLQKLMEGEVTQRNHMLWSGIYLTARYSGPSLSACDLEGWFSNRLAPCVSWLKPSESLKY